MSEPQKIKIGAIYGRVSVINDPIEHGSLEQQKHLGIELAEQLTRTSGINHQIQHVLIEEKGVSGGTTNRPQYQLLLDLIRHRKIDFVIAKEISRISRSTADFCQFMALCKDNNVAVHIRGLDVDPTSPYGTAMFQILSVIAEFERQINRERTKSNLRSAAINNGKINGSPVVLGFDRDPQRKGYWLPNKEELKHVVFLMKKFNETLSYKRTLQEAKKIGIKNKSGKPFTKNSLRCLLTNKKYIGEMYVGDDGNKVKVNLDFGVVIPKELFDAVQENVERIASEYTSQNLIRNRVYPLTGLLFYEDDSPFSGMTGTSKNGDKHFYYACRARKRTIPAKDIEAAVLNSIRIYENEEELLATVNDISKQKFDRVELMRSQKAAMAKELDALKTKEATLIDTLVTARTEDGAKRTVAAIETRLAEMEAEKNKLGVQIVEIDRDIQALEARQIDSRSLKQSLKGLFDRLSEADETVQRGIFRQLFKKIRVMDDNKVEVTWQVPNFASLLSSSVTEEKCSLERGSGGSDGT